MTDLASRDLSQFVQGAAALRRDLYRTIAESHPSLINGKVVCARCGRTRVVDAAQCLQHGWPKCCAVTMSLEDAKEAKP